MLDILSLVVASLFLAFICYLYFKDLKESIECRKKELDYLDQILKKIR